MTIIRKTDRVLRNQGLLIDVDLDDVIPEINRMDEGKVDDFRPKNVVDFVVAAAANRPIDELDIMLNIGTDDMIDCLTGTKYTSIK